MTEPRERDREHERPTPAHQPPSRPSDPNDPQRGKDQQQQQEEEEKEDEAVPKNPAETQQQLQQLSKQVAKLRRQEMVIAQHSSGVIPPVAPCPSMADLVKAGGGK